MFEQELREHQSMIAVLLDHASVIEAGARVLADALASGRKILFCGNGGSAADAQHLATELMVRYEHHRRPLAAIALTTDTSLLTAHTNDYEFGSLFARQVEGLGQAGDCLIAISTSGQSENVIRAAETAREMGLIVIALTGGDGGALASLAHVAVAVPSGVTARIQEAHILIGHYWCKQIEATLDVTPEAA